MRAVVALLAVLYPFLADAQPAGPLAAQGRFPRPGDPALGRHGAYPPPGPHGPGASAGDQWAGQAYGGCYGCSYAGDYYTGAATARRPAPPLRLQGQWRNGWWYY